MGSKGANKWNADGTPRLWFDRGVDVARSELAVERLACLRERDRDAFLFFVQVCHGDGWVEGEDEREILIDAEVVSLETNLAKAAERQAVLRCTRLNADGELSVLDWNRAR